MVDLAKVYDVSLTVMSNGLIVNSVGYMAGKRGCNKRLGYLIIKMFSRPQERWCPGVTAG